MLAGGALIVLLTSIAYFPSLTGAFIVDDIPLLSDSALIRASDGLYRIWFTTEPFDYWPLFNSSLWLEWRLWGMNPTGYHITNLALHIGTALLIWTILRRLSIAGAFLAALLFAVHPVNVETVAWITQRKSLLAMLFFLLSILSYLRSEMAALQKERPLRLLADRWYWLSLAAFVLAMLSKGSVAVLPLVLLLIVWWLRPLTGRDLVRTIPFFVVAVVLVAVTVSFQARFMRYAPYEGGPIERLVRAGAVFWFYLEKALLPVNLSFVYPKWQIRADHLQWWLPLLTATAVTAVLWLYRKSWGRPLLFAWVYFGVSLVPVMGFTDVTFMEHSLVADHYQHLALIGVMALAGGVWATWQAPAGRPARHAVAAVVTAGLVVLTWQQSRLYSDSMTLFRATLERTPDSAFVHNNMGIALSEAGRQQEAIEHWEQAVRLKPDYPEPQYSIARAQFDSGKIEESIASFRKALQLRPSNAGYQYNLGTALVQAHQLPEAIEHLQEALRLNPDYAEAHNNLGSALLEANRRQEAIEHYELALRINPDLPNAQFNLGGALYQVGRRKEAAEHWKQALRLKPDYAAAHNALGGALAEAGQLQEAISQFEEALRLNPGDSIAQGNLEEVKAMQQKAGESKK